jgi:hypothetical protein
MKRWFLRLLIVIVIASAIGAAVALKDQKRRMAEMSDEELRAFLGRKLEGRVPPEKMAQIQDKVTAAVRSGRSSVSSTPPSSNGGTAVKTETAVAEAADDAADAVDVAVDATSDGDGDDDEADENS